MDAKHPIWIILRENLAVICATISLVFMLTFNYNSVDYRDAVTAVVVASLTAAGQRLSQQNKTTEPGGSDVQS